MRRALVIAAVALTSAAGGLARTSSAPAAPAQFSTEHRAPATDGAAPARPPAAWSPNRWAESPLVVHPRALSFDHDGRLVTLATPFLHPSSLETPEPGRWRLLLQRLADSDANGAADATQDVADTSALPRLGAAGGVLAWAGDVWLANAGALWRMTPGSTQPLELVRRVGGTDDGGSDFVGPIMGPDGRLYFAVGAHAGALHSAHATAPVFVDGGAVLRCRLDGSKLEVLAEGFRCPRDLTFDAWGNLFLIDRVHGANAGSLLYHVLNGGDAGGRRPTRTSTAGATAAALRPLGALAGGATGLTSDRWSAGRTADVRTLFVSHLPEPLGSGGIVAVSLAPRGAGFELSAPTPLASGLLPTDLTFGPDGRLYVSDVMSRWPGTRTTSGQIVALRPPATRTAEVASVARGSAESIESASDEQLARWLNHADQSKRLRAQFALVSRGAAALSKLEAIATEPAAPQLARVHALWGLGQLASQLPHALNRVIELLQDPDPEIRAQSARLMGEYQRPEAARHLRRALDDPDQRVVYFAAQSLGQMAQTQALPALIALLRKLDDEEPEVRHAVVVALARLNDASPLAQFAADPSRAVRLGAVLALRRLRAAEIAAFLSDHDVTVVHEAARAIDEESITGAWPALAAILDHAPLDEFDLVRCAMNAHFRLGSIENAEVLAHFASRSYVPAILRADALRLLAHWSKSNWLETRNRGEDVAGTRDVAPAQEALTKFLTQQKGQTPAAVQTATIEAVAALRLTGVGHALWDVVYQEAHPVEARVAALRALEASSDSRLEVAAQHAAQSRRPELRLAALDVLSRLDPAVAWPTYQRVASSGTIPERRAVYNNLSAIDDVRAEAILVASLREVAAQGVPAAAQVELLEAARRHQTEAVKRAQHQLEQTWAASDDPLARYRSALEGGDPQAGLTVFAAHPRLSCIRCHDGPPHDAEAGPPLPDLSRGRSSEDLIRTLLGAPAPVARDGAEPAAVRGRVGEAHGSIAELSARELRDLLAFLSHGPDAAKK